MNHRDSESIIIQETNSGTTSLFNDDSGTDFSGVLKLLLDSLFLGARYLHDMTVIVLPLAGRWMTTRSVASVLSSG